MDNKETLQELVLQFVRIVNKYNKVDKRPLNLGEEKLYSSELHVILSIGRGSGNTVSALCTVFDVTKGAISQTVKRLEKKGFVKKTRNPNFGKEINLSLTEKGFQAYHFFIDLHQRKGEFVLAVMNQLPEEQIEDIRGVFCYIEKYLDSFI